MDAPLFCSPKPIAGELLRQVMEQWNGEDDTEIIKNNVFA